MAGLGRAGAGRQPSMHRLSSPTGHGEPGIAAVPAIATSAKFAFSQHFFDTSHYCMILPIIGQLTSS